MIPIIRVFQSEQQALDAASQIKADHDIEINPNYILLHGPQASADPADSPVWGVDGMPPVYQKFFADQAAQGATVLAVEPPYGAAQIIYNILASNNPRDVELPEYEPRSPAPLSDYIGMPVLSDREPNVRLLELDTKRSFAFKLLSSNPTPLSSRFGLKLLKQGPGDKSFGLPLLKTPKSQWNKSFGLPLLKNASR